MSAYLDTHVTLWLYAGEVARISKRAAAAINDEPLAISPIVLLELQYLHEIGRTTVAPDTVVADLGRRIGLAVLDRPIELLVRHALDLGWTRDPFDRLIVAQASLDGAALITTDTTLRKHYAKALW